MGTGSSSLAIDLQFVPSLDQRYTGGLAGFDQQLVDLDGDGDLDVASATRVLWNDQLHLTFRAGQWLRPVADGIPAPYRTLFAARDLDGDGLVDLLLEGSGFLHFFQQQRDHGFVELTGRLPAGLGADVIGDLDNDGDVDLLGLWLLRNNGQGSFTPEPLPVRPTRTPALGDLDGDGLPDLAFPPEGTQGWTLWLNQGNARFAVAPGRIPSTNAGGTRVFDLDGDGDLDLLGFDSVLVNDGAGYFQVVGTVPIPWNAWSGDLDHDGLVDFVYGTSAAPRIRVLHNLGSIAFVEEPGWLPAVGDRANPVGIGDLDGNGFPDILVDRGSTDTLVIYGRGNHVFEAPEVGRAWLPDGAGVGRSAIGDLDGDGDLDIVQAGDRWEWQSAMYSFIPVQQTPVVLRNHGAGAFTAETDGLPPEVSQLAGSKRIQLGDIDGDGDLDLLHPAGWLANDGSGRFGVRGPLGLASDYVSAGDLDGDGRSELLSSGPMGCAVLRLAGSTFAVQPITASPARWSAFADLDGDSHLDAVVLGPRAPQQSWVLRNDGQGGLAVDSVIDLPELTGPPAFLDANGDGDLDLVFAVAYDDLFLATNDGAGHFTLGSQAWVTLPAPGDRRLGAADFDGDGRTDLAVESRAELFLGNASRSLQTVTHLFWNRGNGVFELAAGRLPFGGDSFSGGSNGIDLGTLEIGDLDNDGDPDLLLNKVICFNRHRELRPLSFARPGQMLRVSVAAAPGYALAPAFARTMLAYGSAHQPLPGLGILLLDPSTTVAGLLSIPPLSGEATWSLPLPANPALSGTDIHLQALLLGSSQQPVHLSNGFVERVLLP